MRARFAGRPLLCLLLLCPLLLAGTLPTLAGEPRTLAHQGLERRYLLENAAAAAAGPAPLVVYLHGYERAEAVRAAGADLSWARWEALDRLAAREGFLVAYPTARLGRWSLFPGLADASLEDGTPLDDVGFIRTMVEGLVAEGLADPQRIYLTGFSDGAIMSYKLLCLPDLPFAAAAPGGGTMYQAHRDACTDAAPPPLLAIAGTDDRILPYDGWLFPSGRELSIPETLEHFRLRHGCSGQRSSLRPDLVEDDGSRVREVRWTGCDPPGSVVLLRVEGAGHTWPGPEPVSPDWRYRAGGHNQDIDAAEEIWTFFGEWRKGDAGAE